ncbi:hypothetical protein BJ508DRAFT_307581 [Ascobolus immersus RN42]|uniref:Uncharacterized protein n=1 Tax=Ascobolus immersus RN42 TaxID=1160509 RepID=A0A3N4I306_ASCIM|nr:hypothetical protein BJ508DRAFT_307581 [Ascobolus immersus RN42]
MNEEHDIHVLENQALRYERTLAIRQRQTQNINHAPSLYPGQSSSPFVTNPPPASFPAQSYAMSSSYRRCNTTPTANPAHFVPADLLHPSIKKGHRQVDNALIDPRAHTVNMRPCAELQGQLTRCYIWDGPVPKEIFIDPDCSLCVKLNLQPRDHFKFEHILYHEEVILQSHQHSTYQQEFQSDSEESGNEDRI